MDIDKITSEALFEKLLKYGYISEKLEPILNSEKFGDFIIKNNIDTRPNFKEPFSYTKYRLTRNNNAPRVLSIPHPIAYINLCGSLKDSWPQIQNAFKCCSKYEEISMVTMKNIQSKRLVSFGKYFKNFNDAQIKLNKQLGKKYLVHADISNFFHSIYSHSLSWALVGNKASKDTKDDRTKWYNKLDFYLRNTRRGETNGVCIGPDTSNIVSELILSKIDETLSKDFDYLRYIDDYWCYCKTKEDANEFIRILSNLLDKYCLSINNHKTKIIELPLGLNDDWVGILRDFNNAHFEPIQFCKYNKNKITDFLDLSIKLFNANEDDSPIKYAIQVLSNKKYLDHDSYEIMFNYATGICFNYPYFINLFDKIFKIGNEFKNFDVKKNQENFLNIILEEHIKYRRSDVIVWSIYLAIKYNLKIRNFTKKSDETLQTEDCIPSLMCFIYDKKNGNNLDKYIDFVLHIISDLDQDEWWLYIYEIFRLTNNDKKGIKYEDFYLRLKNNNVSFLNDCLI